MRIVWLSALVLVIGGCIPPSLYTAQDKRAIAYYEEHTPELRIPLDTERLSNTDIILSGLQVCKALERYSDTQQALANFASRYDDYDSTHRQVIFATGVHGYCPEHEARLEELSSE